MEIQNKNTFSDEAVTIKKIDNELVVYIGKNSYLLSDLEKVVNKAKTKSMKSADENFISSLNYRIRTYTESE